MLLLYQSYRILSRIRCRCLYIPLCFYFIDREMGRVTYQNALHSIMLLLYLALSEPDIDVIELYIPLCFYFIYVVEFINTGSSYSTFHYASTLSCCLLDLVRDRLPLHSIMLLLYRIHCDLLRSDYILYIPLCFYFILNAEVQGYINTDSTFHYASTLSICRRSRTCCSNSLYIPLCFYFMYSSRCASPGFFLYIPLCFYFIAIFF